jgi:hypothetical protein
MMRDAIKELLSLGPFPSSHEVKIDVIKRQEALLRTIRGPISDEEAKYLITLFGADDYFGLAWTVLHLIESAPGWPIEECLANKSNEWVARLRESARRKSSSE